MAAAAVYTNSVSAGGYAHAHGYGYMPLTPIASSPTLVEPPPPYTERPSIKLNISDAGPSIINAVVTDTAGRPLYTTSSNSKRTTLISSGSNTGVATVEWDRSSPRMVFRGRKMKCKEWLPLAGPETQSRLLTHGDARFTWTKRSTTGYLIPADRPGLAVARWRIKRTDELRLEIFQEALVVPGFLEAIVLSVVLLRSGRPLGDVPEGLSLGAPRFFALADVAANIR
ncbi:hypothetical protein BC834DRAFT_902789 [Gloeopeniophorella convolvens]|nr:hypothetical protein BC834DRAFT_902789 [Gloeopeniophorella convolvens]